MKRDAVRSIYENIDAYANKEVVIGGWVRNIRDSKAFGFIDLKLMFHLRSEAYFFAQFFNTK